MRKIYRMSVVVAGVIFFSAAWGGWRVVKIGTCPTWCYQLKVGEGRNDDTNRLYVSGFNGHIYEWTYRRGSWSYRDLGSGGGRMIALAIGDGRGDGITRVYGANEDGYLYEFTFSGGNWIKSALPNPQGSNAAITIGDGRSDGVNRVYGSGWYTPVKEYTWTGSTWRRLNVSAGNRLIWPFAIGDARNDGVKRLYCPDWQSPYVREYTWNGSSYDESIINVPSPLCHAVVGKGRNDGITRVYVSGQSTHIYELTYSSGTWRQINICPTAPRAHRWGLCLGRTRRDGLIRVYSTATGGGGIREQTWDGNSWVDSLVDAVTGASTDITVGPGRNDDTFRIYVGHVNGSVYEITHTAPYYAVESDRQETQFCHYKLEQNRPNPFILSTEIRFQVPKNADLPLIKIYDLTGKEVRTLVCEKQGFGQGKVIWNGEDNFGNRVSPGVYFYRLEGRATSISKKLVVLNASTKL